VRNFNGWQHNFLLKIFGVIVTPEFGEITECIKVFKPNLGLSSKMMILGHQGQLLGQLDQGPKPKHP